MTDARKDDHLRICLEEQVRPRCPTTGLERYRFCHQALPDLSLAQVELSARFLGRSLRAPLIISPMTGGAAAAGPINRRLGEAAQALGIGMGVGSQRAALEDAQWAATYRLRDVAPDVLLMANLGAVQLNAGYGIGECQRAVDMIEADALVLHLNPLQEALQPGGDTDFAGLLPKIERVCRALPVPVVVKEVGCGLSSAVARRLVEVGVSALDVAGAGGTSWSEVERHRARMPHDARVAAQFAGWGIPTADAVRTVRQAAPDTPLIASGGIETGIDVAKCIALGADVAGIALPLLRHALRSSAEVVDALSVVIQVLRVAMFCIGAKDLAALRGTRHLEEVPR
ncbi:MAG: type 2 isopentenyl-diphosphate Delta-isomerase [Anaerolineae bacterium]|nr:type 2 isopentenyl-diphosphate Delta-isomerase [Anaerolineae bacterium]